MTMDSYNNFVQKQTTGKLYIETDDSEFSEEWKISIDMDKLWSEYSSKKITLLDFNNEYATTLINNSENIKNSCGEEAWQTLEPIAVNELRGATNEKESEPIYNKLYDIFDEFEINVNMKDIEIQEPAQQIQAQIEPGQTIQIQSQQNTTQNQPVLNTPENKIKVKIL